MITDQSLWCESRFSLSLSLVPFGVALLLLTGCGGESDVASDSVTITNSPADSVSVGVEPQVADDSASTPSEPAAPATDSELTVDPEPADTTEVAVAAAAASEATPSKPREADDESPSGTDKPAAPTRPAASTPQRASVGTLDAGATSDPAARLETQLAAFEIPPAWLDTVHPKWSTAKPWKEGRVEIRRLLGKGDDASRREGIKLTWDYLQKDDIGNGHEYGMYLFLGNEPLWAVHVYREWVAKTDHTYPPYFGVKALASLYAGYGMFEEAEVVLNGGMKFSPPKASWREIRKAEMHDALGDLYAAWGKVDEAKASYQEAARLFPLGKPPYGRHLLPRKAKKVQSKLDLLSMASLAGASLRDGRYNETALGYSGDIQLAVEVKGGRIANVRVTKHEEKIDQNACVLIPQRIVGKKSLQVDGISGATVTKDAIVGGALRALKKAGLK